MEQLRWKTSIAVLWVIEAVGMDVYMFLLFLRPGTMHGIVGGNLAGWPITKGLGFSPAVFWWIPFLMALLFLTLEDSANRWANFVVGIQVALFCVIGMVQSAIRGFPAAIPVDYLIGVLVGTLIAWYAWDWPRPTS